jgi:hypothetical protein
MKGHDTQYIWYTFRFDPINFCGERAICINLHKITVFLGGNYGIYANFLGRLRRAKGVNKTPPTSVRVEGLTPPPKHTCGSQLRRSHEECITKTNRLIDIDAKKVSMR